MFCVFCFPSHFFFKVSFLFCSKDIFLFKFSGVMGVLLRISL